jgi:hypothetical protein
MPSSVPVINLAPWRGRDDADRSAVAAQLDEALRPPFGRRSDYGPVMSAQFLKGRLDAITVG